MRAAMQIFMNELDVGMTQPLRPACPYSINCSTPINQAQMVMAIYHNDSLFNQLKLRYVITQCYHSIFTKHNENRTTFSFV